MWAIVVARARRATLMRGARGGGQRAHHRAMHQRDRVGLQRRVVALAEAAWRVAVGEELSRLDHQNLRLRVHLVAGHRRPCRGGAPPLARIADEFVDTNDQLGNRVQPRKRLVPNQQLQHFAGRDGTVAFFICRAFALDEGLVQIEQRLADLREASLRNHGVV